MDKWSRGDWMYAARVALNLLGVLHSQGFGETPDDGIYRMIGADNQMHRIVIVDAVSDHRETISIGMEIDGRPVTLKLEAD